MVSIAAVSCPPQRRPQTQQAGMDARARLFRNILRKPKSLQIVIDGFPSDVFNTMHALISLCRASYLISVSFIYHLAVAMASLLNFPASRSSSLIASSPLQV